MEKLTCIKCNGLAIEVDKRIVCTKCGEEERNCGCDRITVKHRGWFSFKTMISPIFIKIVYAMGMIIITTYGVIAMVIPFLMGNYKDYGTIVIYKTFSIHFPLILKDFAMGLLIILLGNMLWRLVCEGSILFFSMYDRLVAIEKGLIKNNSSRFWANKGPIQTGNSPIK